MRGSPYRNLVSNPLEACVAVFIFYAVLLGNLGDDLGSHDGLYKELVALQLAELLLVGNDIPREHHTGLVTVQNLPLALAVAADNSQTVSIRVRSDDEVGIQTGTELHTQGHSLGILWVRADNGWEITVDNHLLRNDMDVLEAPRAQSHRDDDATCAVHR